MIENWEEKIKNYNEEMEGKKGPCNPICPNCKKESIFGVHERRERKFMFILDRVVKIVLGFLIRWKCYLCGKTFTEYPEWAEPYKRYLRDQMIEKSLSYSSEVGVSYRDLAKVDNMPIEYDSEEGYVNGRSFSHVTLHNWVGHVGSWKDRLLKGSDLIKNKGVDSVVHREIVPVDPSKYRSEERKSLLQICVRLLLVNLEFMKLFPGKKNIFLHDF